MNNTPDKVLSERIFAALGKERILSKKELEKLEKSYLLNKLSVEDWVMHVESSLKDDIDNV